MISLVLCSICEGCTTEPSEEAQGELGSCIRESRSCMGKEKSLIQQDKWKGTSNCLFPLQISMSVRKEMRSVINIHGITWFPTTHRGLRTT